MKSLPLVERARALTGEPGLGLYFGLRMQVASHGYLGFAAMTVAIVRFVMKTDEFQRQSFVTAGAIAAVAGAVVTMLLGFLENAGVPRISMTWVWPIDCAAFGIAVVMLRRRYR